MFSDLFWLGLSIIFIVLSANSLDTSLRQGETIWPWILGMALFIWLVIFVTTAAEVIKQIF